MDRDQDFSGKMTTLIRAVGDVAAFREEPEAAFEDVGQTLRAADVTICQNERHYTKRDGAAFETEFTEMVPPENARALAAAGFDVVSCASNHTLDGGPEVLFDTVEVLENLGCEVLGVGRDLGAAREPVILERGATTIGFLSYCSVLRDGHEATKNSPGAAPMRATTEYHQVDYQPGTPPARLTFPDQEDLQNLVADIQRLSDAVDFVLLWLHWGVHLETATIADYQPEVAHAAIDAGADVIVGTHPHLLKGVDWYDGCPIFYSLGNFAFDNPLWKIREWLEASEELEQILDLYEWDLDEADEGNAFPPECRKSVVLEFELGEDSFDEYYLRPVQIDHQSIPHFVERGTDAFEDIRQYLTNISSSEDLETSYRSVGDRFLVVP